MSELAETGFSRDAEDARVPIGADDRGANTVATEHKAIARHIVEDEATDDGPKGSTRATSRRLRA